MTLVSALLFQPQFPYLGASLAPTLSDCPRGPNPWGRPHLAAKSLVLSSLLLVRGV